MNEPFAFYERTAEYVKARAPFVPEIALILGTGLGPLAGQIENPVTLDYREIPNFLVSTAPDHAGKLIFGTLEGKKLVCMSGRFHTYEGYDFEQLSIPVRLFKLLGVKQVIVTNAAGGVNEGYRPGDIMVISDHIKLNGASPMRGKNLPEFGDRFFDVSRMYTPRLRELALRLAKGTKLRVHEGVYFFMPGSGRRCGRHVDGYGSAHGGTLRAGAARLFGHYQHGSGHAGPAAHDRGGQRNGAHDRTAVQHLLKIHHPGDALIWKIPEPTRA